MAIYGYKTLTCVSAPRQLERSRRNADGGAKLFYYESFLLLGLVSTVFIVSETRGTYHHIFTVSNVRLPNLEGHVPVFISPQEQGSPGIPQGIWV
jgi:hypothetical protein